MADTISQMAKALADSPTASVSASGTYSLGPNSNTVIGGGYTFANTAVTNNGAFSGTLNAAPYTVTTGINSPWSSNTASAKIQLNGKDADIKVNDWSLVDAVKRIEERLNILTVNDKLETEWDELKALGDQYRELEAKLKEQGEMWAKLKAMPKVDLA